MQWLEVLIANHKNDWYKAAAGVYKLSKTYSNKIVNLSCKRAKYYNVLSWRTISNICENGLYDMPLDKEEKNDKS